MDHQALNIHKFIYTHRTLPGVLHDRLVRKLHRPPPAAGVQHPRGAGPPHGAEVGGRCCRCGGGLLRPTPRTLLPRVVRMWVQLLLLLLQAVSGVDVGCTEIVERRSRGRTVRRGAVCDNRNAVGPEP